MTIQVLIEGSWRSAVNGVKDLSDIARTSASAGHNFCAEFDRHPLPNRALVSGKVNTTLNRVSPLCPGMLWLANAHELHYASHNNFG